MQKGYSWQAVTCRFKKITYTVFCRIHAPARTPKNPEGCVYSGLIISKSERCQTASGIPELAVSFLMAGKSRVHAYSTKDTLTQLTEIKWLLVILDQQR